MKKLKFGIMLLVILTIIVVLVACQPSNPTPHPAGKVTVVFELNGGEMSEATTVQVDKGSYLQLPVPTRTGYTFLGWFVGEGVNVGQVNDATPILKDMTLVAQWQVLYAVTFETGTGQKIDRMEFAIGQFYTLPTPLRIGYTFLGWYSGEDKVSQAGSWNIDDDINLVARWRANEYTISFSQVGDEFIGNITITYDQGYTLPTPTRTGYTFLGWFDGKNKVEGGVWNIARNTTLVAHWQANTYTVTFETGMDQEIEPIEVTFGEKYTLPSLEREHYTFEGWLDGDSVVELTDNWSTASDVTLVASWKEVEYTVTYNNVEYCFNENPTNITISQLPYTLSDAGKNYHVFEGWYSDAGFTKRVTQIDRLGMTLYAKFTVATSGFQFSTTDEGVSVADYTGTASDVVIPSYHNGFVTSIGNSAFYGYSITSVIIPSSVTRIGNSAFRDCSSLTSIVIPSSVTSIEKFAFYGCSSLTSIVIPSSVTSIGGWAFDGCDSLESIVIPSSVTSIDDSAFSGCDSLVSIEIPSSVKSIGNSAFWGCDSLESIEIPFGVTSIGSGAFEDCSSLTSIVIPSSVTRIGSSAFSGCSSLASIVIPSSVTIIANYAFSGCNSLTIYCEAESEPEGWDDTWNNECTVVWGVLYKVSTVEYNYVKVEEGIHLIKWKGSDTIVVMPSEIDGHAVVGFGTIFANSNVTTVEIPSGVTSIGNGAFRGCSSLVSVKIPSSVTRIGDWAFDGCSDLKSLVIPYGVRSIGYSAFSDCSSLIRINIPMSVTSIERWAFYNCSSLANIVIPYSVTSIESRAFDRCGNLIIYSVAKSQPKGWDFNWNGPCRVVWGVYSRSTEEYNYIIVEDGIYLYKWKGSDTVVVIPSEIDGYTVLGFDTIFAYSNVASVEIPASVTSVRGYAFVGCSNLTDVEIPSSVTSIGRNAFYGCSSLASIVIPSSVTSIGSGAFKDCSSLTSIVIPSSVTSIGESAFYNCSQLTIYCEASSQPADWSTSWNPSNRPVVWGYKG